MVFPVAAQPVYDWARGIGSTGNDIAYSIAVDGSGNVYTTGFFSNSVDFDPGAGVTTLTSAGGRDVFICKLNSSGNFVWARRFGGTGDDMGYSLKVDGSGNIYSTGIFQNTVDFDPGAGTSNQTSAGGWDIYIHKMNNAGTFTWCRCIGGATSDLSRNINFDATGNVFCTGSFTGTVDFDPGAGTTNLVSAGSDDIFINKLNSAGISIWARRIGSTGSDIGRCVVFDGSTNVYTTGNFNGTVDFNPGAGTANLVSAGSSDIYVSKLDSSGNYIWGRGMGGTGVDIGFCLAYDATMGNIYSVGQYVGTADFNPGGGTANLTSAGLEDYFVSKLDANGTYVWARSMGGTGTDYGRYINIDGSGYIYTTGVFANTADFDPGAATYNMTAGGTGDVFLNELDSLGRFVCAGSMGGSSATVDQGWSIAIDATSIYLCGEFAGSGDFDPGAGTTTLTSAGSWDMFILKLYPGTCTTPVVLPTEFILFKAACRKNGVHLNYAYVSESKADVFVLERSKDGIQWFPVYEMPKADYDNQIVEGNYLDPFSENHFYRIKYTDAQGYTGHSAVRHSDCARAEVHLLVYPNPNNGTFTVECSEENAEILISNMFGKVILKTNTTTQQTQLDLSRYANGTYVIQVLTESGRSTQKIIINK